MLTESQDDARDFGTLFLPEIIGSHVTIARSYSRMSESLYSWLESTYNEVGTFWLEQKALVKHPWR